LLAKEVDVTGKKENRLTKHFPAQIESIKARL